MPRLTRKLIAAAKPAANDYFLWDSEVPGFGVRVWPSGRKVYVFQYRTNTRRTRRPVVGAVGALTPERARDVARDWAESVRRGGDPKGAARSARDAPTLTDLGVRYLLDHARPKKRPSSVQMDEINLRLHVLPALGTKKVAEITRADVAKLHAAMRGTPGAANRALALMSKMFNLAEKWDLRQEGTNPCRHVERYRERKMERFLSPVELAQLGDALVEAEKNLTAMPSAIAAIRLLIFTGARRGEILGLRWDDIDFDNDLIRLPVSKTGLKAIYLSAPALEVLHSIERADDQPFVIAGRKPGTSLVNLTRPWKRLSASAGLNGVRIHDLRHSWASVGAGSGVSLPIIGALLGHTQAATTQRYAHLAADPLREANEAISTRIAAAMKGKRARVVRINEG